MALAHFVPEIWSGRVLQRLNKALVYRNVCTTEYEGEITAFGDVVKINEIGPIAVNTYSSTSTGALTVQHLTDAEKLLKIDQAKYYAFWLDDVDNAQTKPKLLRDALDEAAYSLANNIDYNISRLYLQAGLTVTGSATSGTAISSTNVLKYLSLAAQKLDESNTPQAGRWIVVPPWLAQKMTLSKITLDTSNSDTIGSGFLGRTHYGFDVYASNQVYHYSAPTTTGAILCGYKGSIALAVQVLATRQESSGTIGFKSLCKGLVVYGTKVLRPNNLAVIWGTYTAEAS